jgi:hypothetical protein
MKVIDSGHTYKLLTLDGTDEQTLTFVKRHSVLEPHKYPGNYESYPGTTLQSVIRALLERFRYLNNQIWSVCNVVCILCLKLCLWLLEFRAAFRHKKMYWHGLKFSEKTSMCPVCGHTICDHNI